MSYIWGLTMENKKILYKYPRTPHLPWSPGRDNGDKILLGIEHFKNKELVGSVKMDGENGHLDVAKFLVEQGADIHIGDDSALR